MSESFLESDPWKLAADAVRGDRQAEEVLWRAYRPRLKRMVVAELDPRLSARVDPSDVVQEAVLEAHRRLPQCAVNPPIAFYPWLRSIAADHLANVHRAHLGTQARDINREAVPSTGLPDDSVDFLAARLLAEEGSPVQKLMKEELRRRVRETLNKLNPDDRRVLVLRLIEEMSAEEVALVLGINPAAVRMRQVRALERFAKLMRDAGESEVRP